MASLPPESAEHRRERRTALLYEGLDRLTVRLRRLSGSAARIEEARGVRDRYARAVFNYPPGVGGDAFALYLLSDEAAGESVEDLDARFVELADDLDPAVYADDALRRATGD